MKALGFIVAALATLTPPSSRSPSAAIDHVMVGTSGLNREMRDFERRSGVKPQLGGVHPGRGTRNALVSLGSGRYLEIIAPDPAQDTSTGLAAELKRLKRPTVVGWAIGTNDAARLRTRIRRGGGRPSPLKPGARQKPDGERISWVAFELSGIDESVAPFVIQWRNAAQHPSRTAPKGCRLHGLRIFAPEVQRLHRLLEALALSVHVEREARARVALSIDCPKGPINF